MTMRLLRMAALAFALVAAPAAFVAAASDCVTCHRAVTPRVVTDWSLSSHSSHDVDCATCHGGGHTSAADVSLAEIPTPETCGTCHSERVSQFSCGKHASAWAAMKTMPTFHWQPMELTEGMKGCGGCHKIGMKTVDEVRRLKSEGGGYGLASCDACHTRHLFSVKEAREPQACRTCHMGFDHAQWEMYSSSKHGVRYLLKQNGTLPAGAAAPTCQTCHMQDADHEVRTAWGFLAVRLPMPGDTEWAADRATILQGLGVLDRDGKPTPRLELVKAADMVRLDQDSWVESRGKMIKACSQCHSGRFAAMEMAKGDEVVRKADHLMAEAIRIVAGLYEDRVLARLSGYPNAYFDLLTFHDAATEIEQRLFLMFMKHRMRTFQGAFHSNPDYTIWYGWSEMKQDLVAIRSMAAETRTRYRAANEAGR